MPDRNEIEQIASALGTNPGLVEKDWHVVRALGVLASLGKTPATAVFSGGTSLLKGWGLIKRFSEDIDFKVVRPMSSSKGLAREWHNLFGGIKMLSYPDREKLDAAQQAVDLAHQSIAELYKAEDPLLAEHAFELLESLAKMNQKLQRLLSVTITS